jgi:hypothetical protein
MKEGEPSASRLIQSLVYRRDAEIAERDVYSGPFPPKAGLDQKLCPFGLKADSFSFVPGFPRGK